VSRGADDHDVGSRNDIFGVLGNFVDVTSEVAFAFPVGGLGVGLDLLGPDFWAS